MLITSKNNNYYFLDREKRSIMLLHPQLREQLLQDNNQKGNKNPESNTDDYYTRKYSLLKKNGYFIGDNKTK